jgi:ubiquinone/menaquinone biosynthesis C-methylase UbiE
MFHSKVNDSQYLKKQYKDSSNLEARIHLHQRFSVNKYGWQRWIFDQIKLPDTCRILELGCGAGSLWKDNLERIPAGWEISLSDFSAGMLDEARRNLETQRQFQFKVIDAQSIPLESGYFDAVIANHVLQHVPDKPKALSEICRVLQPEGVFYSSTVGEGHLREIKDLLCKFDAGLASWGRVSDYFTLENGMAQLAAWFAEVKLYRYEDALEVTEVDPLVDFILSGWAQQILEKRTEQFRDFVAREMESRGGVFHITKDSGLFVSSRK